MKAHQVMSAELPLANGDALCVSVQAFPLGYRVILASPDYQEIVECETWSRAAHWFHAFIVANRARPERPASCAIADIDQRADGAL